MKFIKHAGIMAVTAIFGLSLFSTPSFAASSAQDILREGLLGAGVGAISAEASGGKAGTGALIGAGTNIIGGALLSFLTDSGPRQGSYYTQPTYVSQPVYRPEPVYVQPAQPVRQVQPIQNFEPARPIRTTPVSYVQPRQSQTDYNKELIKQGLLGAGVGAIAAEASGGKAGKGALIGAGTNILGGVLMNLLSGPSNSQPAYTSYTNPSYYNQTPQKHIIRKYDASGNLVSEDEYYE